MKFEEQLQSFIWKEICHRGLEYTYGSVLWDDFMRIVRHAKNLHEDKIYHATRNCEKCEERYLSKCDVDSRPLGREE